MCSVFENLAGVCLEIHTLKVKCKIIHIVSYKFKVNNDKKQIDLISFPVIILASTESWEDVGVLYFL